jgi:hypothetical protein
MDLVKASNLYVLNIYLRINQVYLWLQKIIISSVATDMYLQ